MGGSIIIKDTYKGYTRDLDKSVSPLETVTRLREKLAGLDLDILKDTVRTDNGRLDIPVFFSVCGSDAASVIGERKQMGKGGTPEQAEASAVMELVERFSLFSFHKDPKNFIFESYERVKEKAVDLDMITRSVSDTSEDLPRALEAFKRLPQNWTWGYNLTKGREVLIPFDWFFSLNEYNGSSAGNCMEEALLQGICEVVERHVSSLVSRKKLKVPVIDPESIKDPLARELIRKFRSAGVEITLSDFSLDTGLPTVSVLAYDPSTFPEKSEIVWTAGTTTSPEKSVIRALAEVAQLGGDFNTGSNYVASGLPKLKGLAEAEFITRSGIKSPVSSLPDLSDDNMKEEIEKCLSAVSGHGMDVIAVDLTHPLLEVPAVYVIIPGSHFRERTEGTSVGMLSAKIISNSGDPQWAVEELKKMDGLLPGRYYTYFFLGLSYLSMGDTQDALKAMKRALELDPEQQDIPTIYSYIGVCLKEMERYKETIEVLKKAEKIDNERTDIYNLMGFSYFKMKEHAKAIECFQKVIELNPGSAIDYANIASNYRDMGDTGMAVHFYRIALELDPTIEFARENLERLEGKKDHK